MNVLDETRQMQGDGCELKEDEHLKGPAILTCARHYLIGFAVERLHIGERVHSIDWCLCECHIDGLRQISTGACGICCIVASAGALPICAAQHKPLVQHGRGRQDV